MQSQVAYGVMALPKITTAHIAQLRHLVPLGFVGIISWSVWLLRFTLSRVYRPVPPGFNATTSVVVPAYREERLQTTVDCNNVVIGSHARLSNIPCKNG